MAPFIAALLKSGLSLVANAALVKGKEYIEEKAGVKLGNELTESDYLKLKQFELENETELRALQVEDNRIAAELRKAELAADTSFQSEAQQTARIEVQSTDEYVRRTRPHLARKSAYVTLGYTVVSGVIFPVVNQFTSASLPGPDAYLIAAMFSPCLAYMGVRSVESFSKQGKK